MMTQASTAEGGTYPSADTQPSSPTTSTSELRLVFELGTYLQPWLAQMDDQALAQARAALALPIQALLDQLGIPATPTIELRQGSAPDVPIRSDPHSPAQQVLRLRVDVGSPHPQRDCRYSLETLLAVYSLVSRQHLTPLDDLATLGEWLGIFSRAGADPAGNCLAFISQLSLEILKQQPGLLFGPAQASAILAGWQAEAQEGQPPQVADDYIRLEPSLVQDILSAVLEQGVSIAEPAGVLDLILQARAQGYSALEISELLIADRAGSMVKILVAPATLKAITLAEQGQAGEPGGSVGGAPPYFVQLRDGLINRQGLLIPDLRFVFDEHIPEGCFAFQINDLVSLPYLGLDAGERLVMDENALMAGFAQQRHPLSGQPCYRALASAIQPGQAVITPLQYLALCLERELLAKAGRILHQEWVKQAVTDIESYLPDLVGHVRQLTSLGRVTCLLRDLAQEGIPLLNLPKILQAILEYQRLEIAVPLDWILLDDQPDSWDKVLPEDFVLRSDLLGYVRNRLKQEISYLYGGGPAAIEVYQLQLSDLEKVAEALSAYLESNPPGSAGQAGQSASPSSQGFLPRAEHDKIVQAMRERLVANAKRMITSEIDPNSDPGSPLKPPILLTDVKLRRVLWELLAPELPELAVLAYSELVMTLVVNTREYISLDWEESAAPQ